ncbi:hypothetical protein [Undibacterium sp.]|uniref:hypothetical protein n=1 Tax=Undibacterium sp. TaxID=1914977 RepID=UPI00374DAB82
MPNLSDFLTNNSSFSGIPTASTSLVTGEAVQQGDMLTLGADSLAYFATDPSLAGATLRPLSQAAAIFNGNQIPPVVLSAAIPQSQGLSAGKLTSGNYVVAWEAVGSPYNVQFAIVNAQGVLQGAVTTVDAANNGTGARAQINVLALSGGGFVIAYQNVSGFPRFAIYDNNGAVVAAPQSVETTEVAAYSVCLAQLSNGGFIIAFVSQTVTPTYLVRYATFSAAGVAAVALTTIETSTAANFSQQVENVSIVGLSGGGFVVAYTLYVSSGTTGTAYFQRFNSAGVLQGARTQIGVSSATTGVSCHVTALTTGFAAIAYGGGISASINIYNALGALQGSRIDFDAVATFEAVCVVALASDGCLVAWIGASTTLKVARYTSAAVLVAGSNQTLDSTATGPLNAAVLSDGGICIAHVRGTSPGFARLDSNYNLAGSVVSLSIATSPIGVRVIPLSHPLSPSANTFAVIYGGSLGLGFTNINALVQKMTFVGVAKAAAAISTSVPVQYLGLGNLRLTLLQPVAVNFQGNTPPGMKASMVGNSILMNGFQ